MEDKLELDCRNEDIQWCADSVANRQICRNIDLFEMYKPYKSSLYTGKREEAPVLDMGTVKLSIGKKAGSITLTNVLYCLIVTRNLVSMVEADEKGSHGHLRWR